MTVGELRKELEKYSDDTKVFIWDDDGFGYGYLSEVSDVEWDEGDDKGIIIE